jgi:methionyl-tRNA formyltransferase
MMKNYKSLRIVFMGTPEFAVASLHKLVNEGCNIVGVITAPDKEAGRGMQLQQSAVKKYAVEKGLHVLQPEKLKNPEFLAELKALHADLQIVVAFRMLPEVVWNMPPMGSVNLHGSLLPKYRGAAPINWAIINGEKETGVTTFKLQQEIDTGNILMQASFPIKENDTAGDIHDTMKEIGAIVLVKTVKALAENTIIEQPQKLDMRYEMSDTRLEMLDTRLEMLDTRLKTEDKSLFNKENSVIMPHAPKIFTETCLIDWKKTTTEIHNLIRGLSPYPAAFSFLQNKKIKIFTAEKIEKKPTTNIGEIETDGKTFLHFTCSDGYISVLSLQMEGKKRMDVKEFLRGYRV